MLKAVGTWGQELRSGVGGRIFPQGQFGDQEVRPGEHLARTSEEKCPKAEAKINIPSYMTPEGEEPQGTREKGELRLSWKGPRSGPDR